jgi:hypothetical protein
MEGVVSLLDAVHDATVPAIQAHLVGRDLAWDLPITEIAFISEPPAGHRMALRVPLGG